MGTLGRASLGEAAATGPANRLREAAAACYVRSPLPGLVQRLRDGYMVLPRVGPGWPRVVVKRRHQASARILIYHRVNDDGDPFFSATPTALFEAEMEFLQKWRRVVSLSEMLRRLDDGPPEPVLAITFDDGYRDNYENALPILRKLGLPATVFLTTGPIDRDEPLWFEQLALAFKRTAREWLDIETLPPERLWLRTERQRLDANAKVFSVLQQMRESERRLLLADVLRRLAAPDTGERRRKMVTWDQARLMTTQGVEFGGHTVTHPFLSRLEPDELRAEVTGCKRRIEDELQLPAEHFAYPNGRIEDIGLSNTPLIREAGYRSAVTTVWGVNYPSTDRFALRRGGPWETNAAVFASKLDWYELTEQ